MIVKVLAVFGFVAVAYAADISLGTEGGKLVFEQNITASPAIWRQVQVLTVNATNTTDEVISRVIVIDNRPEKDGEATVIEGGLGQKNVTLELKSPAVFRGFDFSVKVLTAEPNAYGQEPNHPDDTQETQNPQVPALFPNHPEHTGIDTQNPQEPKDLNVNSNQEPKDGDDIIMGAPAPTASSTTEVNTDDQQQINPALVGKDQPRLNRDTQDQKTKDQSTVPTPVDIDASKDTKVNDNANKTVLPEVDDNLKKALDTIFDNKTQKTEQDDSQQVVPVMPQAESDDLINFRDEEENRKVRQATKEPVVPAFPKELTHDEQTTPKSELSSTTTTTQKNVGQEQYVPKFVPVTDGVLTNDEHSTPKIEVSSSTEKNVGQEKSFPSVVPITSEGASSTPANKVTEFKLPENVQTTQELERNVKGHHGHGHHHAVPLPYVN